MSGLLAEVSAAGKAAYMDRNRTREAAPGGESTMPCDFHADHAHVHGPDCGHASVRHGDHVDYFHEGHVHREHDDHWDECAPSHVTHGEHGGHEHGPDCGHEAISHGDHVDYVHDGHRHAAHEGHWDEH